jgi:DNA repair protein RadD
MSARAGALKLRDYQVQTLEQVARARSSRVLVVAPTGAGKGTMATELIARTAAQGQRAMFVVHRREIIRDITERLRIRGIAATPSFDTKAAVRVMSVQAALKAPRSQAVHTLVLDEAHHYAAFEWNRVIGMATPNRVVGFTATPQRADGKALGDMFETLIDSVSYSELLRRGIIVPCRVLRPASRLTNELAQDPVEAYLRYSNDEAAIMFVRSVEDAIDCSLRLNIAGVPAGVVHAGTPARERDQTMHALAKGDMQVVVNVGVLTEGVDVPHVSCLVLARSCSHASTYVQIAGRVLRSSPGKEMATLIDLVGASHRHGLPGEDRVYSLEGRGIETRSRDNYEYERHAPSEPTKYEILDCELEEVFSQGGRVYQQAPQYRRIRRPEVTHVEQDSSMFHNDLRMLDVAYES